MAFGDDDETYKVVVNHEEQYSIWFHDREIPNGWREAGKTGNKAECLAYIEEVWTDMRPLSVRRHHGAVTDDQDALPEVQER
jgi:MbtH protein